MALTEVLQVFYVDEVVAGMPDNLGWGQIHVLRDPARKYKYTIIRQQAKQD